MRGTAQSKKKKHYPQFSVRVADALALQQRIAAGEATTIDERAYQRIITCIGGNSATANCRRSSHISLASSDRQANH